MNNLKHLREEITDLENVDDDEEDVATSSQFYSISSYGIDYPVEILVKRMNKKKFYLPDFQRKFVWTQNQASRFIESLLLGLPVPGIFLFNESKTGKHLVIDGQQRLRSLQLFFNGNFNGREFRLRGINSEWLGKSFTTLDEEDQLRLSDAVIHSTVFKQDAPKDEINSVYEVFERINTGGIKLSPQEIRSCVWHGTFNDFLHELNDDEYWRRIFGKKSTRLKDVEAILRFFAFFERGNSYSSPMKHFLNEYMDSKRNCVDMELIPLRRIFSATMEYVLKSLGESAFRPERALNIAVFDSVATSIAHMIEGNNCLSVEEAKIAYDSLIKNSAFIRGFTQATADKENVSKRFMEAKLAFGVK